ncbi:MAG: GNAT family N-acetyltransferase [Ilumatobacteraceae bacterium]
MESAVRGASPADLDGVVAVLTDAFEDDPLMTWAFPDPTTRRRRIGGLWTFMAGTAYLPFGSSTMVPGPDAAALWLAPGQVLDQSFWEASAGAFVAALDGEVERLSSLSEVMAVNHPVDEHWYLLAIGVSPVRQGGRLGSALLAHTLAVADAGDAPAFLEATSPRSRALYQRHGFEVLYEVRVDDSPPMWPMLRAPTRR